MSSKQWHSGQRAEQRGSKKAGQNKQARSSFVAYEGRNMRGTHRRGIRLHIERAPFPRPRCESSCRLKQCRGTRNRRTTPRRKCPARVPIESAGIRPRNSICSLSRPRLLVRKYAHKHAVRWGCRRCGRRPPASNTARVANNARLKLSTEMRE